MQRVILALLALPLAASAAPRSAALAQQARDLSVKAETATGAAATFAWENAAAAYQTWLTQYDELEDAGRMQYGYATALAGAGRPMMALEQFEGVLARTEGVPVEMQKHCVRASLDLAEATATAHPEDAEPLRRGQVRVVDAFAERHPEHEALPAFRVAAGDALLLLGDAEPAATHFDLALQAADSPAVAEPAVAGLLAALEQAASWEALGAAVATCAEHPHLTGAIPQQKCRDVGARAGWQALRALGDDAPLDKGTAMLAFAVDNPQSPHRAAALVEAAALLEAEAPAEARKARVLWLDEHPLAPEAGPLARSVAESFGAEEQWGESAAWWEFLARYHGGDAGLDESLFAAAEQAVAGAPDQAASALRTYLEVWPKGKKKGKAKRLLKKLEKGA